MRVIKYSRENLLAIAFAQVCSVERVENVYDQMCRLFPADSFYAMDRFEPLESNPDQKIEYIREDVLAWAFNLPEELPTASWIEVTRKEDQVESVRVRNAATGYI